MEETSAGTAGTTGAAHRTAAHRAGTAVGTAAAAEGSAGRGRHGRSSPSAQQAAQQRNTYSGAGHGCGRLRGTGELAVIFSVCGAAAIDGSAAVGAEIGGGDKLGTAVLTIAGHINTSFL